MTTVLVLARPDSNRARVEGILRWAVLAFLLPGHMAMAQDRPVHWLHAGAMPPGAIGSLRLHRGRPLSGYFQPVRIRAPQGARIALVADESYGDSDSNEVLAGMHIGMVYRLKVIEVPNSPGVEIFPTVEIIDRLYPPPGLALRYPIPIELTQAELELAARGAFVTRVVYVEDPQQAVSVVQTSEDEQPWFEAAAGEDPLVSADLRGRPVAILRMGGRIPAAAGAQAEFGPTGPPYVLYDKETAGLPQSAPKLFDE